MNLPILDVANRDLLYLPAAGADLLDAERDDSPGGRRPGRKFLEQGIGRLLGNETLKQALYNHPLIRTLAANERVGSSVLHSGGAVHQRAARTYSRGPAGRRATWRR